MKPDIFSELLEAANDALEHAQGKRDLKKTVVREVAPMTGADVRHVRETLHTSQALLAHYLKVSPKLVQAWEANRRVPNGPALVLLRMMEKQPGLVDAVFASRGRVALTSAKNLGSVGRTSSTLMAKSKNTGDRVTVGRYKKVAARKR